MPSIDRIPGTPTRLRRALDGIGSDFVPYTGAIKDVDLGTFNLTTTGLGTFGNLDVDTLNFNANVISDSTGTISFDNENLTTTGVGTFSTLIVNSQTVADDARGISSITQLVTSAKSDGIAGYFEGHIDGTTDGPTYAMGAWLNVDSGSTTYDIRALDIGIYESGADCSGGNAYGLAIHMEFDNANPPAAIYPIRLNTNVAGATPDALIFAANKKAVPITEAVPGVANAYTKIVTQGGETFRIPVINETSPNSASITTTGLITAGSLDVDTLNLDANVISDSTGTISFDNENLTTTGTGTFGGCIINGVDVFNTNSTDIRQAGSNSSYAMLSGSDDTNGAYFVMYGDEHAGAPGDHYWWIGGTEEPNSLFKWFYRTAVGNTELMRLTKDANLTLYTGTATFPGTIINGVDVFNTNSTDIRQAGSSSAFAMLAGSDDTNGAYFVMYGDESGGIGSFYQFIGGTTDPASVFNWYYRHSAGSTHLMQLSKDAALSLYGGIASFGDGGTTNYLQISATGDLKFAGSAGLVFGNCYGNHIGWSQANAAQNTWYNIADADMISGPLNNVTHDGNGKLTVTEPGMYLIGYSVCFEDNVANDHIEIGIEVTGSGSANAAGQVHLENKFASEEEHSGSSCILDLADNATIEAAIRTTDAGTPTISVQAVNITCTQVGGT